MKVKIHLGFQHLTLGTAGLCLSLLVVSFCSCAGRSEVAHSHNENGELVKSRDGDSDLGPYMSSGLDRVQLKDRDVLRALTRVPRHEFVPEDLRESAYEDRPLPIGKGQTISQPFIVALMTQEAGVSRGSRVLEIGTGSGYQAAVLSELGATVFSIEIVPDLATKAAGRLERLGYASVTVKQGDGWEGWESEAPFDAIIVTASAPKVPEKLLQQLANRGRLVVPVEEADSEGEELLVIERQDGSFLTRNLGAVRFVPLTGEVRR